MDPSRIRIVSVASLAPRTGTREFGHRARSRLRTEVKVLVLGATRVDGLDAKLQQFGVPWKAPGLTRGWQVDHLVEARRSLSRRRAAI